MKRMLRQYGGLTVPRWFLLSLIAFAVLSRCSCDSRLSNSKSETELKP